MRQGNLLLFLLPFLAACSSAPAPLDAPLALHAAAPDFTLPSSHGGTITLTHLHQPVLLVFYLGYSCPRCVSHLRALAEQKPAFDQAGVQILAISPDTVADSQDAASAYGDFPFPLLADPDLKVARAYHLVFGQDTLFHGIYLIDAHGKIRFGMKASHPYEDWDALLRRIKMLGISR